MFALVSVYNDHIVHLATNVAQICIYYLNCTIFSPLILRKIIKTVATRCHILRLKCTTFDFSCGFTPNPAGGANSDPPDLLAGFGIRILT